MPRNTFTPIILGAVPSLDLNILLVLEGHFQENWRHWMAPSQISKIGPKFVRKFYARTYIEVKDANLEQSCPNKKLQL